MMFFLQTEKESQKITSSKIMIRNAEDDIHAGKQNSESPLSLTGGYLSVYLSQTELEIGKKSFVRTMLNCISNESLRSDNSQSIR